MEGGNVYFQYPIESLARHRATADQLAFVREAGRMLSPSDDLMFEPLDRGLAIFAAHEDALEQPRRILLDTYGDLVEVLKPKVRYMPGEPASEPIMHVRISARREHAFPLITELKRRGARILEECTRGRVFIVRAEAPMASLLGLPARLDKLTQGSATHSIRLVRYSPARARSRAARPSTR